jgi:hypothetical protein
MIWMWDAVWGGLVGFTTVKTARILTKNPFKLVKCPPPEEYLPKGGPTMCPSTAYQGAETLCIYMYECNMQSTRGLEGQPTVKTAWIPAKNPFLLVKKKKNAKTHVSDMKKYFFSKPALMNIHTTHDIYKIAVRKKFVWKYFFVRDFSSAAPTGGAGVSWGAMGPILPSRPPNFDWRFFCTSSWWCHGVCTFFVLCVLGCKTSLYVGIIGKNYFAPARQLVYSLSQTMSFFIA